MTHREVKFWWCLGHHGNGRFIEFSGARFGEEGGWKCISCGHVATDHSGDAR